MYKDYLFNFIAPRDDFGADYIYDHYLLLTKLYETDFKVVIPRDVNREIDGLSFRKEFDIHNEKTGPCSVLEMMIALLHRAVTEILGPQEDDDNTIPNIFWNMIVSMKLSSFRNEYYNDDIVSAYLRIFNNRTYEKNGAGGLVTVNNGVDMRKTDIWYQFNYYLVEHNI